MSTSTPSTPPRQSPNGTGAHGHAANGAPTVPFCPTASEPPDLSALMADLRRLLRRVRRLERTGRMSVVIVNSFNHSAPGAAGDGTEAAAETFEPSRFQMAVLCALEGKALRSDALGEAVRDRTRLFRHPGGLKELREQGLVKHERHRGYFRPDAPPPEWQGGDER